MLKNIYSKILINDSIRLNAFNSLSINSDINELSDTCTILVPLKNMSVQNGNTLIYYTDQDELRITVGDNISIELAYYSNEDTLDFLEESIQPKYFQGYIREFNLVNDNIEIICDDYMYLFKKQKLSISETNISLTELINGMISELAIDKGVTDLDPIPFVLLSSDIELGKFRTDGYVTPASILQQVSDEYKLFFYFKNVTSRTSDVQFQTDIYFIAGLKYDLYNLTDPNFSRVIQYQYPYINQVDVDITQDYYNPIITNSLDYENFDKDNELIVVGTSINQTTLDKITLATDGVNVYNYNDAAEKENAEEEIKARNLRIDINIGNIDELYLEEIIIENWNNYPTSGFKGEITVFGEPLVTVGDKLKLKIDTGIGVEDIIEEVYYVDKVTTYVNQTRGFTQKLTLGKKTVE